MLHIAQGFYEIGYNTAYSEGIDNTIKGFQRLPSAVVNFSFAVELMLKALNLITSVYGVFQALNRCHHGNGEEAKNWQC